jgi:hypothetical protein
MRHYYGLIPHTLHLLQDWIAGVTFVSPYFQASSPAPYSFRSSTIIDRTDAVLNRYRAILPFFCKAN